VRVCFFNRSYWPDTGATGQLLTELAEDLVARHGFEVTVVAGMPLTTGAARPPTRETRSGVRIVRAAGTSFRAERFAGRVANYLTYFSSAIVAALRLPRQDVVVALTDPPIIGLAALAARRRGGFVFFCQDIFPEVARLIEGFRSPVVEGVLDRVNRTLLARATRVIALGETMKARLVDGKGADPAKVTIIHNWADTSAVQPAERSNAFSRAHGLDARFVVLHAGNIGLSQNLDVVLDAARLLRQTDPHVLFLFIGDGSRRTALEARAQAEGLANVRFLPYQPRADLRWTYATADVCLVSLKSGLAGYIVPSKLYTILASGRPYIAAVDADSEVAALTRTHDCGVLVAPGDAGALADAVRAMAADPERRLALGARARAASACFSRERQVAAHAAALRSAGESAA
jgi:glycosyltransferase involved in cell wall biosynthesis